MNSPVEWLERNAPDPWRDRDAGPTPDLGMEVATLGEWTIRADIPPKALSDAARRLHAAHGTRTESPEATR